MIVRICLPLVFTKHIYLTLPYYIFIFSYQYLLGDKLKINFMKLLHFVYNTYIQIIYVDLLI